jgi:hypothetical protein
MLFLFVYICKCKGKTKTKIMQVEFELNLDSDGRPCIKFRHYDKHNSLEQKALKVFIDAVKEKGLCLVNTGGFRSDKESFEKYEIRISS